MRYSGGLLGGSWLTAMISDLGKGKVDGTDLVMNFDSLGPAYWLWGKQYQIYADVDAGGQRYLEFERWWGDFTQLNGDELQFLVDNLFIGDKLARNQLQASDGKTFDLRTSARRSSCSPPRATTSARRPRRSAGSPICTATSTISAPPAGRSFTA